MAQLIYRVTGRRGEERVFQTFRNTDEGRKAASALAAELENMHWLRCADSLAMRCGAKRYPSNVRSGALGREAVA